MYRPKTRTYLTQWIVIAAFGFFLFAGIASTAPVTAETAASAVQGWLRQDPRPLGRTLSARQRSTDTVKNSSGDVLYYIVHLDPAGFVILSSDDALEPIVAFSATGSFDPLSGSAMAAVVNRDVPSDRRGPNQLGRRPLPRPAVDGAHFWLNQSIPRPTRRRMGALSLRHKSGWRRWFRPCGTRKPM